MKWLRGLLARRMIKSNFQAARKLPLREQAELASRLGEVIKEVDDASQSMTSIEFQT